MQKGHWRSPVPILLSAIILCLQCTGVFAQRAAGPLLPINGMSLGTNDPAARPYIGHTLPTPPLMMTPAQGSGPNPDDNLTETATGTQELYANGAPGFTQNRIVFSSNGIDADANGQIDPILPPSPDFDIWIMRSDGSEQYRVADMAGDQVDPVYDPGGRLVCFASKVNGIWQIFTLEVRDPSIVRQITTGAGNKRHPTWAPDSNTIAFQDDVNGNWDIYKIASTGVGFPVQVTVGPANDTDPAWSTTGFLIAFTREIAGLSRIYTTPPDGSDIEQISDGGGSPSANDKQPAWRETSAEIAFASSRLIGVGDTVTDFNIWRMPAAGEVGGAIPILVSNTSLTDTANDTDPAYTVDIDRAPTRISFTSTRAGSPDLWAMQMRDWIPPSLMSLPTVNPRLAIPGDDVTISVPVYDKDSGVQQVIAYIKDPDRKIYQVTSGISFDAGAQFIGEQWLEWDSVVVGSVELLDNGGNGVFTGDWTTQAIAAGRDYIVDIQVTDVAGNSLVYDDIYGFSTRMFSPRNNILFVDDYCEGQLFLAQLGWNNDFTAAFPVESYYTYNPGTIPSMAATIDFDTIRDAYGEGYDTWRIICRGPIPASVYQYYLPTIEYQLDPSKLDDKGSLAVTADRQVPVADRAVVWAAPHTGDVWTANGGIIDASTQADVALFVQRGGRLFISGEDIAWALTMNGTQGNTFLATTLRAGFVQDSAATNRSILIFFAGRNWRVQNVSDGYGIAGQVGDVVADDPWGGGHAGDTLDNWYDSDDNPLNNTTQWTFPPPSQPFMADCAEWSKRPDAITVLDAVKIYGIAPDNAFSFAGPAVGLRYRATSVTEGTVVYLSFGFEQINRGYHLPSGSFNHCRNKRSHLMHNALCWSRTGGFQGRVVSISDGGQAVNDPSPIISASQGGTVRYAVRCQRDGTYVMQGLQPGHYDLSATRPGFEIDKYDGEFVHGGQLPRTVDFAIKRGEPGAVTGKVTAATGGAPLANVQVSIAVDPTFVGTPPSLPGPVGTAADGTYTLPYVPAGPYIVTADGTPILYGTGTNNVTVSPGDTATADFALNAANGTLVATVTDINTTDPIQNAAVKATTGLNQVTTGFTDGTGMVSIPLAPGSYSVGASAPGYTPSATQNVAITPAATVNVAFALQQEPGGRIVGRVIAAGSGGFVSGVTVRVFFGADEIASALTSAGVVETIGATQYNYKIENVPTGEVRVEASRTGFTPTPASRTAQINSLLTTRDVNFSMSSLRTFPTGLQLVSFPWDYSGIDPALLLNAPGTFRMAAWEASMQRYRVYPEAPADRFRLGSGYWLSLATPLDLSQEGTPATDPVELPLGQGWNLIGCPYPVRIDFYTAQVRDPSSVVYTLQQAMSQGLIGSGLYAYVLGGYQSVGVLSPYIGYWLKTNVPCSLIVSRATGALAVGAAARDGTPQVSNGWLMQLKTKASGVLDTATYLGAAAGATEGCDFALDQAKPPVPAMGAYVYTAIDNRGWAQSAGDYAVDVRPSGVAATWDLTVYSNLVGEQVTVSWDDLSRVPREVRPMLTDLQTGQRVFMRTSTGYSFKATGEPRRLKVTVSPDGIGQLAVVPQAAVQTAAGVAISYTLSRAANVDVVITNIAGRAIRRLSSSDVQSAGLNTLTWDGRDRNGLSVPAGQYLVTITGRTETGQESRAVVPLQKKTR